MYIYYREITNSHISVCEILILLLFPVMKMGVGFTLVFEADYFSSLNWEIRANKITADYKLGKASTVQRKMLYLVRVYFVLCRVF